MRAIEPAPSRDPFSLMFKKHELRNDLSNLLPYLASFVNLFLANGIRLEEVEGFEAGKTMSRIESIKIESTIKNWRSILKVCI